MAGVRALRRIQLGKETTAGSIVNATTKWRGLGMVEDQRETVFAKEEIGFLAGVDRVYTPALLAALAMDETEATFEQLPHILEAGVKLVTTGVVDTGGTGYVYTYPFPTTAANTTRTYTIEGGDDNQEEEMEYGFVESFKLSGVAGEALKVSANWLGRQLTPSAFTGALGLVAVEEALFAKATVYVDTATFGTTTASQTVIGMELNAKTGLTAARTADGQLYFTFVKQVGPELSLRVTFEHDATAVAQKAAWRAGSRALVRVNIPGSLLTTAGTFTNKTVRIDAGGKWAKFDKIGEKNGNDIVTGELTVRPDTAGANYATITVVNQVAVLP